ncbi:MAG: hypothetical protein H7A25_25225 [Leptospiraceae bacterium]|nr:hypothetical protein [Leptospiraceae bacterium]MCP5503224.1 hypothetical protein [Leptospiraceae bacterium]
MSAEELLQMDLDKVFPIIEKLNKEETAALITQIRSTAKTSYKDIDKFYLLISQLESIKAIAIEEKRLKDLHLVYGLGLFLFSSVLGYVIFSQRKIIQSLQQYLDK